MPHLIVFKKKIATNVAVFFKKKRRESNYFQKEKSMQKFLILMVAVLAIASCQEQDPSTTKCGNAYQDSVIDRVVSESKCTFSKIEDNSYWKWFECDSFQLRVRWNKPVKFVSNGEMLYCVISTDGKTVFVSTRTYADGHCDWYPSHRADSLLNAFIDKYKPW